MKPLFALCSQNFRRAIETRIMRLSGCEKISVMCYAVLIHSQSVMDRQMDGRTHKMTIPIQRSA